MTGTARPPYLLDFSAFPGTIGSVHAKKGSPDRVRASLRRSDSNSHRSPRTQPDRGARRRGRPPGVRELAVRPGAAVGDAPAASERRGHPRGSQEGRGDGSADHPDDERLPRDEPEGRRAEGRRVRHPGPPVHGRGPRRLGPRGARGDRRRLEDDADRHRPARGVGADAHVLGHLLRRAQRSRRGRRSVAATPRRRSRRPPAPPTAGAPQAEGRGRDGAAAAGHAVGPDASEGARGAASAGRQEPPPLPPVVVRPPTPPRPGRSSPRTPTSTA